MRVAHLDVGMQNRVPEAVPQSLRTASLSILTGTGARGRTAELGNTVSDLRAAGFSTRVIGDVMEQTYRMFDNLGVSHTRMGL